MATKVLVKKEKESFNWGRFKVKAAPYVFISPFYIGFLIFGAFPIGYSVLLCMQQWNGIREMKFVGLENFVKVLNDWRFYQAIGRTFIMMAANMLVVNIMALFFSFVLNSTFVRGKEYFKTVFFLPYITSTVSVGLLFAILYGTNYGLFNWLLSTDVMKALVPVKLPILWTSGWMSMVSITFLGVWKWVGWVTILYLAGLQSISKSLYEAAQVDGASWPQVFFRITLPLLKPIIYFNITMGIIGGMQGFDEAAILLGRSGNAFGGVDYSGVNLAIYLYNAAFSQGYYGRAAATSYLTMFIILILSQVTNYLFRDKD